MSNVVFVGRNGEWLTFPPSEKITVVREPTDAIAEAGIRAYVKAPGAGNAVELFKAIYAAMIKAAAVEPATVEIPDWMRQASGESI